MEVPQTSSATKQEEDGKIFTDNYEKSILNCLWTALLSLCAYQGYCIKLEQVIAIFMVI